MDERPALHDLRRRRARRHAPADAADLRAEGPRPAAAHAGNTRLYSEADLERLRLIQRLTTELGLNLAGVERVLALEDELQRLQRAARAARARDARGGRSRCTGSTAATSSSTDRAADPTRRKTMDFNKLTLKSQEAVAAAQELARRRGNPEIYPEHLLLALLDQELPQQLVPDAGRSCARRPRRRSRTKPSTEGAQQQPQVSTAFSQRARPGRSTRRSSSRTSTSRPSTCCSRSTSSRATSSLARIKRGARRRSASRRRTPRAPTRRSRSSAAT